MTAAISNTVDKMTEIVRERFFTPMYFYFLTSWAVVNWRFIYTLLFVDNDFIWTHFSMTKVEYLASMYGNNWFLACLHLLLIPASASYFAVWWLSKLSERFFRRYEEHQMNKRAIQREVEYREKVAFVKGQREIREQELDKRIPYEQNEEFNHSLDDSQPLVQIAGVELLPSETLYRTDYEAYKEQLAEYEANLMQMGEDLATQAEIDKRRGK